MNAREPVRTRDIMQPTFTEIDGLATVAQAVSLMKSTGARVLIVKKRSEVDEHGIVLLSDIAKHVLAKNRSPERVNVYEIMSKPVVSVDPNLDIRYCARLFDRFGLSVVPVMDDGKVVGIVSYDEMVLRGL